MKESHEDYNKKMQELVTDMFGVEGAKEQMTSTPNKVRKTQNLEFTAKEWPVGESQLKDRETRRKNVGKGAVQKERTTYGKFLPAIVFS